MGKRKKACARHAWVTRLVVGHQCIVDLSFVSGNAQ